ncbi:hypothetical protein [Breoghania sp. L-A4]|uniref:hypothetical protein n=1 Tax=Breoghania sp. L-A4 TaxID=2304600 RepID=UPI0013C36605|nr:hypothetical protein [Breoghania sp. L-A4]
MMLGDGFASRPIDPRDIRPGNLVLCQMRNRSLPVAAAIFAEWIAQDFGRQQA